MTKVAKVKDFPRYSIWSNGMVWSDGNKRHKPRFLKEYVSRDGYAQVYLSNDNGRRMYYVHRLVADAFLDRHEGLNEVNHKDGNKLNNILSNLEWSSRSNNMKHAFGAGLKEAKKGESNYNHKLSDEQVRYIRNFAKRYGKKYKQLAEELGVAPSTVRRIAIGESWSHV